MNTIFLMNVCKGNFGLVSCVLNELLQEHTLFGIVKRWSQGPQAGARGADLEEQLLSLVGEIRLEHVPPHSMTSILDDPWLHKVPPFPAGKFLTAD